MDVDLTRHATESSIGINSARLHLRLPEIMGEKMAILVRIARHGRVLRTYAFDQDLIRIGRDPQSDIALPSKDVSRIHSRLERWEHVVTLVDSGSSNGTRVNGKLVQSQEIETGDTIQVGDFVLWIQLLDSSEDKLREQAALEHFNEPTVPRP